MLYKWIIRNVLLASDLQLTWKDMAWRKKFKKRCNYNLKDYFYWHEPQIKKMAQPMFNSWGLFASKKERTIARTTECSSRLRQFDSCRFIYWKRNRTLERGRGEHRVTEVLILHHLSAVPQSCSSCCRLFRFLLLWLRTSSYTLPLHLKALRLNIYIYIYLSRRFYSRVRKKDNQKKNIPKEFSATVARRQCSHIWPRLKTTACPQEWMFIIFIPVIADCTRGQLLYYSKQTRRLFRGSAVTCSVCASWMHCRLICD